MKNTPYPRVAVVMQEHLFTLNSTDSLGKAEEMMKAQEIRHLPVMEEGILIGMLSWNDLRHLKLVGGTRNESNQATLISGAVPVSMIMTPMPHWVTPERSILEAATIMMENGFQALPVLQFNRLVGIITKSDILQWTFSALESTGASYSNYQRVD